MHPTRMAFCALCCPRFPDRVLQLIQCTTLGVFLELEAQGAEMHIQVLALQRLHPGVAACSAVMMISLHGRSRSRATSALLSRAYSG
mmetsp:Transcript_5549/g.9904  ORF Transcript_5549/g.9904 Transcript_5549/m.9904 type:complete len:87 (-) Transcript_5549:110-370(-)